MVATSGIADAARTCEVFRRAVALAEWVGTDRRVTAKHLLSRADVAAACAAAGVEQPGRVRSAGDVPDLHLPWTVALGAGLLTVTGSRVVPGPTKPVWLSGGDDAVLAAWMHGLTGALTAIYGEGDAADALEIGHAALTVLENGQTSVNWGGALVDTLDERDPALVSLFLRGSGWQCPADRVFDLLAAFGATDRALGQWQITPLGRWALAEIARSAQALLAAVDPEEAAGICRLKVSLRYVKPACWRRLLVPADMTLGHLHTILQIAFDWDGDHLHSFTVGQRTYGDPYFDFEYDEYDITLATVFARARKPITYTYDLGDNWEHEIALEQTAEPDPSATYPWCADGRGDTPVEDWNEEFGGTGWIPFDQAAINTRLARLNNDEPTTGVSLQDDIAIIVTDAYNEDEQLSAFLTVLGDEIDFPVPATLLDIPVTVTGLDIDDAAGSLVAGCEGHQRTVTFTDLEFRPGTVEAWLQAAYLTHLGKSPVDVTPPIGWDGLQNWVS